MLPAMRRVIRTVTAIGLVLSTRRDLLLEVLALHHQLAVLARSNRRFRRSDRLLWLVLRRIWPRWRDALMLVQPATVDRWHRDGSDRLGGAASGVLDDHASIAVSRTDWALGRRIVCGALRGFTASCSSSESSFRNARCRGTCGSVQGDRHRPGVPSSRMNSASSQAFRR